MHKNNNISFNPLAEDSVLKEYAHLVTSIIRSYYLVGGDKDDLYQEGMIALLKAIRNYDPQKEASFNTYANRCIKNHLFNVIKSSNSSKQLPLNSYIELSDLPLQTKDGILSDYMHDDVDLSSDYESLIRSTNLSGKLSVFEKEVLDKFLSGQSLDEMSRELGRSKKSIDNAIQRIKRKIKSYNSVNR